MLPKAHTEQSEGRPSHRPASWKLLGNSVIDVLTMEALIWQIIKNQQKSWIECIGINPGNSKLENSESTCDPYPAKNIQWTKRRNIQTREKHEETWQIIEKLIKHH